MHLHSDVCSYWVTLHFDLDMLGCEFDLIGNNFPDLLPDVLPNEVLKDDCDTRIPRDVIPDNSCDMRTPNSFVPDNSCDTRIPNSFVSVESCERRIPHEFVSVFVQGVSPEEEERRRVRRERNKVAAAKCRQRRVDHTNRLLNVSCFLLPFQ